MKAKLLVTILLACILNTASYAQSHSLKLTEIASDLNEPYFLTAPPDNSDRLIVIERGNRARTIREGSLERRAFLDLEEFVSEENEFAFKSIAFPPDYKTTNTFFITYNDPNGDSLIAKLQAEESGRADDESLKAILKIIHSGNCGGIRALSFGPHNLLYIGIPASREQSTINSFCGRILRVEVLRSENYTVPTTNPFLSDKKEAPEVWSTGFNNIYSLNADLGKNKIIGFEKRLDGKEQIFSFSIGSNAKTVMTKLGNEVKNPLVGGYLYNGNNIPEWKGKIVFAEKDGHEVLGITEITAAKETLLNVGQQISGMGQDNSGEIYILTKNGAVLRIDR